MDIRTNGETASNRLLNFMSGEDRQLLTPHLKHVELMLRQTLEKANQPIEHVYFLEDGIASVVGDSKTFGQIEIGIIGREGVTGLQVETERAYVATSTLDAQLSGMMGDAPFCDVCGHITIRNGACYKCMNCGNSLGCS